MRIEFSRNAIKCGMGCGQKHSSTSGTMANELKTERDERQIGGRGMSELPISTLKSIIFGDDLVELDKSDPDGDSNADIKKFLHDAEVANKVGKSSGATVLLDMSVPDGDVDTGDEPLYKSPRVIPALRKPSGQGFVKVIATIR